MRLPCPTATRFVLSCIRQRVLSPAFHEKVCAKLESIAAREFRAGAADARPAIERELNEVRSQREQTAHNMAKAKTDAQFEAMSKVFDKLLSQEQKLEAQLREILPTPARDASSEVEAAMAVMDRIESLAKDTSNLPAVSSLFTRVNTRLFFSVLFQRNGESERCTEYLAEW